MGVAPLLSDGLGDDEPPSWEPMCPAQPGTERKTAMKKISMALSLASVTAAGVVLAVANSGVASAVIESNRNIKRDIAPVRWER